MPALLRGGWRTVRRGGWRLLAVFLASQTIIIAIGLPVIYWLFKQSLYASGLTAVDMSAIQLRAGSLVSLGLLGLILLIVLWAVSLQLTLLVIAVKRVRQGLSLAPQHLWNEISQMMKRLLHPRAWGLFFYLFIVLPLAGFGFFSAITQAISIPSFITGELMKSVSGQIIYLVFILGVIWVNIRLALTVPVFASSKSSGFHSMRLSFRFTGRTGFSLQLTGLVTLLCLLIVSGVLLILTLIPTALTDEFVPSASPVTAAISLAVAQVLGVLISATLVIWFVGVVVELLALRVAEYPDWTAFHSDDWADPEEVTNASPRPFWRRHPAILPVAGIIVVAVALAGVNLPVMHALDTKPDSLVIAHRGWSVGGVENTISGLDAAASVGADVVEMDVMQTADGKFVVMHDANLSRLAGISDEVKDLTLEQLVEIEVHDLDGNSDVIPSLSDYVAHADDIGMTLLLELKPHGAETDDVVELFADEMRSLGSLQHHLYHSLDKVMIERLKELHPTLMVGYTMAAAGVAAPETTADFIVVEDFSVTAPLLSSVHEEGKSFFVWTVNDAIKIRQFYRDQVDGIITDHPDIALEERKEMNDDSGLSEALFDAVMRFVVVF